MSNTLYRKYRPQSFTEVVGQDHIKQVIQNELKSGSMPHAFLFSGPRGIGKTTMARLIAKSINCENLKEGEPCNVCEACQAVMAGKALDVIEIDAASHTGVDNVRENIIDNSRVAPSHFKNKVFIIDEVHMLSISAFNALLKTLEEPPANTYFILATTESHKLPETIISRCQRFDFKKVPANKLAERLTMISQKEKANVNEDVIKKIVHHSEGAVRDSESLLGQILSLDEDPVTLEVAELVIPHSDLNLAYKLFDELASKNASEGIATINSLIDQGIDLNNFDSDMVEFLRKLMLYKVNHKLENLEYMELDKENYDQLQNSLEKVSGHQIMDMIEIFIKKGPELKTAEIPQLPLELAVVEICFGAPPSAPAGPPSEQPQQPQAPTKLPRSPKGEGMERSRAELKSPPPFKSTQPIPKKKDEDHPKAVKCDEIDDIKKAWPDVVKAIRESNHSLALTVQLSHLICIEGETLTLGLKYKFHSDRICEAENLEIIEKIISDKIKRPVRLQCILGDEYDVNADVIKAAKSDNIEVPTDEEAENVWDLAKNTYGTDVMKSSET
ncbi:DNA polymerase III subunit gamma/tau [Patescibacteria group bacterium]|nr:DNA polymerase III subunit gamma/tau [Patescibacteria group bacterium]MBU1673921.1 DNA polymerase III subunit gamma/tau [Patescibacteria group bacterium]MBU1963915.1 DNA polymerase III subunit gamma/tau [Patescibacteria group bacterium]